MSDARISYEEAAPSPYAGFWRRVGASIIDALILFPAMALLLWLFWSASPGYYRQPQISPGYYILSGFLVLAYRVGFESSRHQATLGKKAMNIMVTDLGGHPITPRSALIRSWVYWAISGLAIVDILFGTTATVGGTGFFMFFGYIVVTVSCIMVAFTEHKQGGHDFMADCLVVRKGARFEPPPPGSPPPGRAKPKPIPAAGALPAGPPDQERYSSQRLSSRGRSRDLRARGSQIDCGNFERGPGTSRGRGRMRHPWKSSPSCPGPRRRCR